MVIKKICLDSFGKFNKKVVDFSEGVNILYGENEAGKTTLHTFIKAMLFGLDGKHGKNKESNEYEKYIPWDDPENYKGSMVIEADGVEYLIERNFLKSERSYKITRLDTGVELDQDEVEDLFYGFDENCYYNTISISQLGSITSKELEKVLKNYTANLGSTKTTEINVEEALNQLEDTKEGLIAESEIDKKEQIEQEIINLQEEIKKINTETAEIVQTIESKRRNIAELRTKVKALEELDNVQTERQIKKTINHENLLQKTEILSTDLDRLKKDKERAEKHRDELKEMLDSYGITNKTEIDDELEWLQEKRNISIVCIIVIVASLAVCVGMYISNGKEIVFSDYTTWIKEVICLGVAFVFGIVFIVAYFVKKNNKTKKMVLLKELKVYLDRYDAAKSEAEYANRQIRAKQKEFNNVSYEIKADNSRPNETSDYNTEIDEIQAQISAVKEEISKSQWILEQRRETVLKLNKQLEKLNEKLQVMKSIGIELEAIEEAKKTINHISEEIRRGFGRTLNEKASVYMSKITNEKYSSIDIDEELNIKIETKNGKMVPIEKLSKGTIEQMYMSLRLAAAEIIFEEDKKPILLDDAFVMYDNKRMSRTMKFMDDNLDQVIIFSCHTREKVMADRVGIKYNLIMVY